MDQERLDKHCAHCGELLGDSVFEWYDKRYHYFCMAAQIDKPVSENIPQINRHADSQTFRRTSIQGNG